jgi:hypothetical protein
VLVDRVAGSTAAAINIGTQGKGDTRFDAAAGHAARIRSWAPRSSASTGSDDGSHEGIRVLTSPSSHGRGVSACGAAQCTVVIQWTEAVRQRRHAPLKLQ